MRSLSARRISKRLYLCLAVVVLVVNNVSPAKAAHVWLMNPPIHSVDQQAQDVEPTLGRIRQALKLPDQPTDKLFRIEGRGKFSGEDSTFRMDYDDTGRYVQWIEGPLSVSSGFDGKNCWKLDWNRTPQLLEMRERDEELLGGAFSSLAMFMPGAQFKFEIDAEASTDDLLALTVTPHNGELAAQVFIDRETFLPASMEFLMARGTVTTVDEFGEFFGRTIPTKVSMKMASGQVNRFVLTSAVETDSLPAEVVAVPERPTDFSFDASAPAELPIKQAPSGHLLVQAQLNGDEPAWFILDTGAGSLCVSTSYAQKLQLPGFGAVNVQGVGGSSQSQFRRAESLKIGPLTMKEPTLVEMDLDFLEQFMGVPISGILGFEMFSRCVAEIDFVAPSAKLYDADTYELSGAEWEELFFATRHPAVRGTFDETGEGIFTLDTGAAGSTLVFHTPAVKRLKLLEGRETTSSSSGGVGGAVNVELGTLSSFRFGGHEFKDQQVGFATEDHGAFATEATTGVLGGVWIRPFIMVLDYPHKRIAFAKKPE